MKKLTLTLTTLLALTITLAAPPTAATTLDVMGAIAFTDGTLIACPPTGDTPDIKNGDWYCVDTREPGYSTTYLRQFALYGLSTFNGYTVVRPWELGDTGWTTVLLNVERGDAVIISLTLGGSYLIYLTGKPD